LRVPLARPAGILVDLASLNPDDQVIVVLGKGHRPGVIPFGCNTKVRQRVDRCTKLTTEQRAGEAHRRVSLGDRI
jgi:hypothetical protein